MSRLQRILQKIREETRGLKGRAPPGASEPDLSLLDDEQLDRLDELITRARLQEGDRMGSAGHRPGRNERDEEWQCDCYYCQLPAQSEPLSDEEWAEVEELLVAAGAGEAPRPWEGKP